jgi:hypothetical protein
MGVPKTPPNPAAQIFVFQAGSYDISKMSGLHG